MLDRVDPAEDRLARPVEASGVRGDLRTAPVHRLDDTRATSFAVHGETLTSGPSM